MKTKICTRCNRELDETCFSKKSRSKDGLDWWCKECNKKYKDKKREIIVAQTKEYYHKNKDYYKEYRISHAGQIKDYKKKHYEDNKENYRCRNKENYEKNKEKYLDHQREYNQNNKEKRNSREKSRRVCDPLYRLKQQTRSNIYMSFLKKKHRKTSNTSKIVGCDLDFLCSYLKETYYQNYGVEYDGTQNVHIDHIVPLSTAKTEKDVYRLCHYTNLQLLNAKDNLRKSDKLDFVL